MQARVLHGRLYFLTVMKSLLKKPYHLLKKSGIIIRIWQPEIKTIYFKTKDGPLIKYTHKGRTVALYWTKTNFWQIRRPYDFVIGPKPKK